MYFPITMLCQGFQADSTPKSRVKPLKLGVGGSNGMYYPNTLLCQGFKADSVPKSINPLKLSVGSIGMDYPNTMLCQGFQADSTPKSRVKPLKLGEGVSNGMYFPNTMLCQGFQVECKAKGFTSFNSCGRSHMLTSQMTSHDWGSLVRSLRITASS